MSRAHCLLTVGECLVCLNALSGTQATAVFGTVMTGLGLLHVALYAAGCADRLLKGSPTQAG